MLNFFLNATPISFISKIPITSRPASRTKAKHGNIGFKDLRAIPGYFLGLSFVTILAAGLVWGML